MVTLERLCGEQNHRCAYCGCRFGTGEQAATRDHVRTRASGGTDAWTNLVAACYRCNNIRGQMNAHRFFRSRLWERVVTPREMRAIDPDWVPPTRRACATLAAVWPTQAEILTQK